jgi:hypothetical protein
MDDRELLESLEEGELMAQIGEALRRMSAEVRAIGKPGMVNVKFKITKAQSGDPTVVIAAVVQYAPPALPPSGQILYLVDGDLHRADPRQTRLPLRQVDIGAGELREPDTAAGPTITLPARDAGRVVQQAADSAGTLRSIN